MNERLKNSFDKIKAEEELKENTKTFIYEKTKGYTKRKKAGYRGLIPAMACLMLVIFGGYKLYFTPTVEISIDVNPSIELGINRFDKIISVNGYNSDGDELAGTLDIKYLSYTDAIDMILANDSINALLENGEVMVISIIGSDDEQSVQIMSEIESCTSEKGNTYCQYAHSDDVCHAHDMGLSYGKYSAYLELRALDSAITVEDVQNMTMREIRELIASLSGDSDSNSENGNGYGHGNGHGHENEHNGKNQS